MFVVCVPQTSAGNIPIRHAAPESHEPAHFFVALALDAIALLQGTVLLLHTIRRNIPRQIIADQVLRMILLNVRSLSAGGRSLVERRPRSDKILLITFLHAIPQLYERTNRAGDDAVKYFIRSYDSPDK